MLTLPCLITMVEEMKYEEEIIAHAYRHLIKTKDEVAKATPNYDNVYRYVDEQ